MNRFCELAKAPRIQKKNVPFYEPACESALSWFGLPERLFKVAP